MKEDLGHGKHFVDHFFAGFALDADFADVAAGELVDAADHACHAGRGGRGARRRVRDVGAHEHGLAVANERDVVDALVEAAEFLVDLAGDVGEVLRVVVFAGVDVAEVAGEDAVGVDAVFCVAEHLDALPELDVEVGEDEEDEGDIVGCGSRGGRSERILNC